MSGGFQVRLSFVIFHFLICHWVVLADLVSTGLIADDHYPAND
jgi:hypothetical protein